MPVMVRECSVRVSWTWLTVILIITSSGLQDQRRQFQHACPVHGALCDWELVVILVLTDWGAARAEEALSACMSHSGVAL